MKRAIEKFSLNFFPPDHTILCALFHSKITAHNSSVNHYSTLLFLDFVSFSLNRFAVVMQSRGKEEGKWKQSLSCTTFVRNENGKKHSQWIDENVCKHAITFVWVVWVDGLQEGIVEPAGKWCENGMEKVFFLFPNQIKKLKLLTEQSASLPQREKNK